MNEMIEKAYRASEVWYREGIPTHWDSNNVVDLGLMNDNRYNQTKMNFMKNNIGYDKTKIMLGLSGYEYNFTIFDTEGNNIFSFGNNPSNPSNLLKIERIGILQSSIVTLEVMVWS
jgi:hypothetical protein